MYGIVAEDASDCATLTVLTRRLARNARVPVLTRAFGGCGGLLKRGGDYLRAFSNQGARWFIVCCDADHLDPAARRREAHSKIVKPAGVSSWCIVVPIQEIEAWMLADLPAFAHLFGQWRPADFDGQPERVDDPKKAIERLSRMRRGRSF